MQGVPADFGRVQTAIQQEHHSGKFAKAINSPSGPTCSTRQRAPVRYKRLGCFAKYPANANNGPVEAPAKISRATRTVTAPAASSTAP